MLNSYFCAILQTNTHIPPQKNQKNISLFRLSLNKVVPLHRFLMILNQQHDS